AFGAARSSAATNLVRNPGFETGPCGFDVICGWSGVAGTTMAWDLANPHSGSASMKLSGTGLGFGIQAGANCVKFHPGPHLASFWYRTSDADATEMILGVERYVSTGCSFVNSGVSEFSVFDPVADGTWHQVTGTLTAPPATKSAFV